MVKETTIIKKEYFKDLNKIKKTIKNNQAKAISVVNSTMIMFYYEIGTIINERKVWKNKYIERLSNEFSINEIAHKLGAKIPWRILLEMIFKSNSRKEMLWYINQTYILIEELM